MTTPLLGHLTRPRGEGGQADPHAEGLIRPMLEALATLTKLEATYLTVLDWARREEEVRFVFSAGQAQVPEGHRIPMPAELSPEAFPGVTRSPRTLGLAQPDSLVARDLGFKGYVSVPVTIGRHQLYATLCGVSRGPREISETVVSLMESFAAIIGDHIVRAQTEASEDRETAAKSQLLIRARFLAEAEHRLKTPLTVLHGMSLTLRDRRERLTETQVHELHDGLVRNVAILSHEVENLIIEARAEVRIHEPSPVHLELRPLIHELVGAFDGLDTAHDVVADVPHDLVVTVDPIAIYQVLGHLLDNAIKYSPDGGRITVRATETPSIRIEVIDEGVGLPSGVDVFAPFRRGDMEGESEGVGLGLHIVRKLVDSMGGTVTAHDHPGAGATFTVMLPLAAVSSVEQTASDAQTVR